MHKVGSSCLIVLLVGALPFFPARPPAGRKGHSYISPDKTRSVSVIPVGKTGREQNESLIEFRAEGKLLCGLNYSSSDDDHGFGVVKAAWTPDSQYFVFSLASSGGHQGWHAPTQFYDSKTGVIRTLDDYLDGAGISQPDFKLLPSDVVATAIWEDKDVPVSVRLDSIAKHPPTWPRPFLVHCVSGRVLHVDEPR